MFELAVICGSITLIRIIYGVASAILFAVRRKEIVNSEKGVILWR